MLQLQVLRTRAEWVKERLAVKRFQKMELVDQVVQLDDQRRRLQAEFDQQQSQVNTWSKEIGQLMAKGERDAAEEKKQAVAALKAGLDPLKKQLQETDAQLQDILLQLPNLPAAEVPEGKTPEENVVVRTGGTIPELAEGCLPHWDLASKYGLIDFEIGNKVTGSGFPFYRGKGAKLQRALIQYFLDFNTASGYEEFLPPYLVNADSGFGTGQLPDKEGQMYFMPEDGYYLIPTAEVPVTNVYRDVLLKSTDLPIKMTAYSPCFRREAGSYGKDVRGLNRLHQFEKVEIIQLVRPENSHQVLDEMVAHVEKLVQSLELPYRILRLCGGDMGFASAITYDFEIYSTAQQRWLEVSSVSNFESFQANRMKCRFKDEEGKTQFVHSLNGSSLALPRIVAGILENHQTVDGIKVPAVLQSYMGMATIQ
ncbi:MAG: serine--tRNA ligase [Hydrotalea sp.]|nr:serine--tRNA ligase [Hydrotalea sp.]